MRWTLAEVAGVLGVSPPGGVQPLARLAGVSIDSRTLRPGELFVAIHGPRHDGHTFVEAALAAGAPAAVVGRARLEGFPEPIRGRLFPVEDTVAALQSLARAVRRQWGRRMAGVTGSTGKTTTKEMLAALLATRFRVLKSEGNLNNEYGLPLALLKLEPEHEAAVVELGMSHRGEIAQLARIAEPQVGVVTNVAPVHLEFFQSVDEIALAKRELIEGLAGDAPVAVLNADDARVARFRDGFRGRVLTFGLGQADFCAEKLEDRGAQGSAFDCASSGGRIRLELPLVGRHNVSNALAALAAASVWGMSAEEAQGAFRAFVPAAMRGQVLRFADGFTVINDCYNSNPLALEAMTNLLAADSAARRRVLVAGEMLELGATSPQLHRAAGQHAAKSGVDWVIAVQGQAAEIVAGAVAAGMARDHTRFFATSDEAGEFLASFVTARDLLLVKGSRGVKMERAVEALQAKFPLAASGGAARQGRN